MNLATQFQEGNNLSLKFKTPEERKKLLDNYVFHVTNGYSDESFVPCDMQTFRRYVRDFPSDFDTDRITEARRQRQLFWENVGRDGTTGSIQGFNASSWKFNMANRFDWREKKDVDHTIKERKSAEERAKILIEQINENETTGTEPSQKSEGSDQPTQQASQGI